MGIKDIFKKLGEEAFTDERGRKVSYGQLMGTGYKYQIISDKLTKYAFNEGKYIGKKEGYVEASYEYEKKLLQQANKFLEQRETFNKENDEYRLLLNEYENYIEKLENREYLSIEEKDYLNQLLLVERKLKRLK